MQEGGRAKVKTTSSDTSRERPRKARNRNSFVLFAAALVTLLLDQGTKAWALHELGQGRSMRIVGDLLALELVRNSGSAFGLFADFPLLIFAVNVGIMVFVVFWGLKSGEGGAAFGLIAGGGLGNLADRAFRAPGMGLGEVVDFISLSFWPTFNLADSAIVVGVGWLMLHGLREESR